MTAFEKSLRALNEESLRTGAEELLTLLEEAEGIRSGRTDSGGDGGQKRRGAAAARVSALVAAAPSPEKSGGRTPEASGIDASASDETVPEAARARRTYPKTESGGTAAEKAAPEDDEPPPEAVFSEAEGRKDREALTRRKSRGDRDNRDSREGRNIPESRDDRGDRDDRESKTDRRAGEGPEAWEDPERPKGPERRKDREGRDSREEWTRMFRAGDSEAVDRVETRRLGKRLQAVSEQRRGEVRQSGEDGAHTAAFRGPERQYEGAVGARGTEMRRISDYFRRDSRRYDTGFTRY